MPASGHARSFGEARHQAVVDIFRRSHGTVPEHRSMLQPVTAEAAQAGGPF